MKFKKIIGIVLLGFVMNAVVYAYKIGGFEGAVAILTILFITWSSGFLLAGAPPKTP
jgi:hypothetical protein